MRVTDVRQIGQELAIKWEDRSETYILLETLRRHCPCAGCQGETDVMGHLHKGPAPMLVDASFQLRSISKVGGYGIQPVWADGHATGIYSFDYLKRLGEPTN